ncbi:MAG: cupin domain-containing protein [Planctomycetota bacterium]|jgi:quercetin dioxygenase-like cupin family protein
MKHYKVDFDSMLWEKPDAGFRFKAYEHDGTKLRLVELTKEFVEPDWCTNGHIGYVLQGQMEIDFNGNTIIFSPGDGVFIPPGEKHKHKGKVLEDVVKLILVEEA